MTEEERIRAQLNDEAVEEMPTSADMDPEVAAAAEEPVGKRGRGRPPKVVQIQSVQEEIEELAVEISAEERLHPLLSNSEVLEARAEARQQIEDQRRKQARKRLIEEEKLRLHDWRRRQGSDRQDYPRPRAALGAHRAEPQALLPWSDL